MEAKLKDRQTVEATVEVTVPAAEVDKAYERVLRQLSRQVSVPGFRPGKAPRGVLVRRVGKEALEGEVREELIESSYAKALKQFELTPVHAHVHGGSPNEGQDFTFELHVDLYPDVDLGSLNEIVIDSAGRQVDEEMVAFTVARLQSDNATMVPVDRPVEAGDYLLVETVAAGESEGGSTMPIDLESVGEELVSQLVGHSAGDVVNLRLAEPPAVDEAVAEETATAADADAVEAGADDADEPAAAPQEPSAPPTLEVRIKDVKAKEKPEADDEFAKTLGFETWQETLDRVRESLQAQLDQQAFEEQRDEFVEKLIAGTSFELPRSLVQRRRADMLENLAADLRRRGLTIEEYVERLEREGGREEFERELQESAEKGVRRDLVLEQLLEQRGTRLSDAEFEASLRQLAMQQGMDVDKLRRERGEEWLRNYRFLLTRDRALNEAVQERLAAQRGVTAGEPVAEEASPSEPVTAEAAGEQAEEGIESGS
jgi:trigger factor